MTLLTRQRPRRGATTDFTTERPEYSAPVSGGLRPRPLTPWRRRCVVTRTFRLGERFYGMSDTAVAAKKTVEVGKRQILEQRFRIQRQHEARHERDGYPHLVADAVRTLDEMDRALARMEAHYAKAQEHLAEATVDESSLAEVERETPM